MPPLLIRLLTVLILGSASILHAQTPVPPPPRELRGAWIATVHNINWPTAPGLPAERQQEQLRRLIQNAHHQGLNCLIFQVRPAGDALYESAIEPWSPYLTGRMGQAPSPKWDPLAFAIEEAHRLGMELHAWFNPFRAQAGHRHATSANHIRQQHPQWTLPYGRDWWMDPGVPEVRQRSIDVILDVTRRYDVDGIHIDDYFYPYPLPGPNKKPIPFPDDASYLRYRASGGTLERNAWRRQNVDATVQAAYAGIKTLKRWVKFGISPFGLWRPNHPEGTGGGLDPYEDLAADSRKWLQQGWLDYLAPQLYWTTEQPKLGFATFYDWWLGENSQGRHIWPGMNTSKVGEDRNAGDILRQISILRERGARMVPGHFHWNVGSLEADRGRIATLTRERAYHPIPAIPPASPWLSNTPPPAPSVEKRSQQQLRWGFSDPRWQNHTRWWVVQALINGQWRIAKVLFHDRNELDWPDNATAVAVRAAGRAWEIGPAAVVWR